MFDITFITHETDEEFTPDLQNFVYENFEIDHWKTIAIGLPSAITYWMNQQKMLKENFQVKKYGSNLVAMV